jgi:hypothetical protein
MGSSGPYKQIRRFISFWSGNSFLSFAISNNAKQAMSSSVKLWLRGTSDMCVALHAAVAAFVVIVVSWFRGPGAAMLR